MVAHPAPRPSPAPVVVRVKMTAGQAGVGSGPAVPRRELAAAVHHAVRQRGCDAAVRVVATMAVSAAPANNDVYTYYHIH